MIKTNPALRISFPGFRKSSQPGGHQRNGCQDRQDLNGLRGPRRGKWDRKAQVAGQPESQDDPTQQDSRRPIGMPVALLQWRGQNPSEHGQSQGGGR